MTASDVERERARVLMRQGIAPDEASWMARAEHLGGPVGWLGEVGFPPVGPRRLAFRLWCLCLRVHRSAWMAGLFR